MAKRKIIQIEMMPGFDTGFAGPKYRPGLIALTDDGDLYWMAADSTKKRDWEKFPDLPPKEET